MSSSLYLIRHGETEWSLSGRHTGRTELALTMRGEDAARALGERLREIDLARVLTSPRLRARRTCELTGLDAAAHTEPLLAEWDYGDYEGLTTAEIVRARPGWNVFRDGCPGGETPQQVSDRADELIARLRGLEGNSALFSHGHFGRVLAARWLGLPVAAGRYFLLSPASLSQLGYEHERRDQPALVLWNATAHDASIGVSGPPAGETGPVNPRALQRWENEGGEIPGNK